jgi:hypothetical protein
MSPAQICGSILLRNWTFQGVQIARNRAYCKAFEPKWPDLISRAIDSWNGGASREDCVLVQRGVPRHTRFGSRTGYSLGHKVLPSPVDSSESSNHHDHRDRLSATFISLRCTDSPSFVRHAPTRQLCYPTVPLLCLPPPASTPPRCRCQARCLSRACLQYPGPLSRPLLSPAAASFIAVMCIAQLCWMFPLSTLRRCDRLVHPRSQ